jgi:multiple sugar transport system permease protein
LLRKNILTYALLSVAAVLTLAPYLLSIQTSVKTARQFASDPALAPPSPITGEHYAALVVGDHSFVPPLVITVQVAIVAVLGELVCSAFAAYAFARLRFPGRDALFWVYLATLMVPFVVVMVPRFAMLSEAGLRDTFWGIVLPTMFGTPYAVFLLREFFRAIPEDLLDAARIDGAGEFRIYWSVVLPLCVPALAANAIFTFQGAWEDFLWPLIIINSSDRYTAPLGLALFVRQNNTSWNLLFAGSVIATLPMILIFIVFQRRFIQGIAVTGVKG